MGFKLAGLLLVIMGVLGTGGYFMYQKQAVTIEEQRRLITALEFAQQQQNETIDKLQDSLTVQTESLREQSAKNQEIAQEMDRYLDIFRRHSLGKLAAAKPGLIEPRVNNATKEVFDAIEKDTQELAALGSNINAN